MTEDKRAHYNSRDKELHKKVSIACTELDIEIQEALDEALKDWLKKVRKKKS